MEEREECVWRTDGRLLRCDRIHADAEDGALAVPSPDAVGSDVWQLLQHVVTSVVGLQCVVCISVVCV